jgi:hypothetical protein
VRISLVSTLMPSLVVGLCVSGCSAQPTTPVPGTATPAGRFGSVHRAGFIRSWMSPNAKREQLLYVSQPEQSVVDVYSVPAYSLEGQITDGIDFPQGVTADKHGNLYVANLEGDSVTIYPQGGTSPTRTLSDSYGPLDVALTKNGYVLVGDNAGGVDVFPPNASSPSTRLTNADLSVVAGVAADAHNDAYAAGNNVSYAPVVVKFKNMAGPGTNLNLSDLVAPSGILIDASGNVVVSDYSLPGVNIYAPRSKKPSATIANSESPDRSAFDKMENLIYVPEGTTYAVNVYDYPSGTLVQTVTTSGFTRAAALSPPAKP